MQYLWWPLHGIPSRMRLKNSTTLSEATRTNIPDGPPCIKKGTRKYNISPIFSIPYTPNWVSKTLSIIWFSNTADCLHRYIQTEMEFLDIASLGRAYRYVVKIEQKLKKKRQDFVYENSSQLKQGKGSPNPHSKGLS
jgi:hypothetical protein